jgi:pantetheine-phosphate adenylyltransferase
MPVVMYPGSFDPLTNGHLNLIERGLRIYGQLIVAVAHNHRKAPLFTPTERMDMIRDALPPGSPVEVVTFEGLLVDYARKRQAQVILRGLRAVSDFEFEFQLAHLNRRLGTGLETVFMMTGEEHFYVSSHMVREVASFGGNVTGLVPPPIERRLKEKFAR